MAENSHIAWTDSTFNPMIGCTKVSPGCKYCYAEELMDKRYQKVVWGPKGERSKTSESYWKKPLQWNSDFWLGCELCGLRGSARDVTWHVETGCSGTLEVVQRMVFCASLSDIFEKHPAWVPVRKELFSLIDRTPNLVWQLLTKRADQMLPLGSEAVGMDFNDWLSKHKNVWMGVSVENQKYYDERVPELLNVNASIRWLSVEPQIGEVRQKSGIIDWVVVGGESGKAHRPFDVAWARSLRDECNENGSAFFMKQIGGYPDKLDKMVDFPVDLRIRNFPAHSPL